jgi:hypothetical protein
VCFVFTYENRAMVPDEIVLRRREEKDEGEQWSGESKIHRKHICKCHNENSLYN